MSWSSFVSTLDKVPEFSLLNWHRDRLHLILAIVPVFVVYLFSMPRQITLEDAGTFVAAATTLSPAHPPGYPLYVLLSHLFTWIPFGSLAFRVSLFSALFGAATCGVLWCLLRVLLNRSWPALLAVWIFGFSQEFWSQSIIPEVYTLNSFLTFLLMFLSLCFLVKGQTKYLMWLAFLLGLSLCNHWPMIRVMIPIYLLMIWPRRRQIFRLLPLGIVLFGLGLLPYVWMIFRANQVPELAMSFYGPLDTFEKAKFYILRTGYREIDVSPTANIQDKIYYAGFFCQEIFHQFTFLGGLLAFFGFARQWRCWPLVVNLSFFWGFFVFFLGLLLLLGFDFQFIKKASARVYPLVPYGIMSCWIALAFDELLNFVKNKKVVRWCVVLCPFLLLAFHWPAHDRRDESWTADYAQVLLDHIEPNAIVFTHVDTDTGPLTYASVAQKKRPDLRVMNDQGFVFSDRLYDIWTTSQQKSMILFDFVNQAQRPIYFLGNWESAAISWKDYGLFRKLDKDSPRGARTPVVEESLLDYCQSVLDQSENFDDWIAFHRQGLIGSFARCLALHVHTQNPNQVNPRASDLLDQLTQYFSGQLNLVESLLYKKEPQWLWEWTQKMVDSQEEMLSKDDWGKLYYLRGLLMLEMKREKEAGENFKLSVDHNPHYESNYKAMVNLFVYYANTGQRLKFLDLEKKYYKNRKLPEHVQDLKRLLMSPQASP